MKRFAFMLIIFLVLPISLFSNTIGFNVALYGGLDGISDLRDINSFPLRTADSFEVDITPFAITFDRFSIGPTAAYTITHPTRAYNNVIILGCQGYAYGIDVTYRASEEVSLGVECRYGHGKYDKTSIYYASFEGFLNARYYHSLGFIGLKAGVSYKKETLSAVCRLGVGVAF